MRPLTATYRVQLNKQFTLKDARGIVPYLDRLGISHLYCSPVLAARPGSTHGYDGIDPTRVNPEIGSIDDLRGLSEELRAGAWGFCSTSCPTTWASAATTSIGKTCSRTVFTLVMRDGSTSTGKQPTTKLSFRYSAMSSTPFSVGRS